MSLCITYFAAIVSFESRFNVLRMSIIISSIFQASQNIGKKHIYLITDRAKLEGFLRKESLRENPRYPEGYSGFWRSHHYVTRPADSSLRSPYGKPLSHLSDPSSIDPCRGQQETLTRFFLKRRGWDSNPRYSHLHTRSPGVPIQPLLHLSESM